MKNTTQATCGCDFSTLWLHDHWLRLEQATFADMAAYFEDLAISADEPRCMEPIRLAEFVSAHEWVDLSAVLELVTSIQLLAGCRS